MNEPEATKFIAQWNKDATGIDSSAFTDRLREIFDDSQIALFLKEIDRICLHCFNGDTGCQCWNDE